MSHTCCCRGYGHTSIFAIAKSTLVAGYEEDEVIGIEEGQRESLKLLESLVANFEEKWQTCFEHEDLKLRAAALSRFWVDYWAVRMGQVVTDLAEGNAMTMEDVQNAESPWVYLGS